MRIPSSFKVVLSKTESRKTVYEIALVLKIELMNHNLVFRSYQFRTTEGRIKKHASFREVLEGGGSVDPVDVTVVRQLPVALSAITTPAKYVH